jgi:hypothetical protein
LIVQRSIKADLITKPPSGNGVQIEYSGLAVVTEDFRNSVSTDLKLGKPGIFSFPQDLLLANFTKGHAL